MRGSTRYSESMITAVGLAVTLGAAVVLAIILMVILSEQPATTIYYFFVGPFQNRYYFGNMLNSAIPLVFTGLGIAIAFRVISDARDNSIKAGVMVVGGVAYKITAYKGE